MAEIGIVSLHAYVPPGRIDVVEEALRHGATLDFARDKIGFTTLARRGPDENTSDLAEKAAKAALDAHPGLRERVGLLVVVTQTPDGRGLPHVAAIVHGRLGLSKTVAAFDLGLGCSGWVYALSVAKSFMTANGIAHGLLVTADPYSKIVDPADRNTALLFGDAATATVLGEQPLWSIGVFSFGTDGTRAADLMVAQDDRLTMNGRAIFTFSATMVPECVRENVARNGKALGEIDLLILHQASRYIVRTVGERLEIPDRVPFWAERTGNTVSSSIPLMLCDTRMASARTVSVCGFGVGLSWAATLLSRCDKDGTIS